MSSTNEKKGLESRSPIVAIIGHVDHGKTSLLDYIRKHFAHKGSDSRPVADREAGGITQSILAYEADVKLADGKQGKITFIDTPGHEAFSKMRSRGATVADFGVLVVASDESIKPQTREAIKILKDTNTHFVVAITKIDRTNSDVERVKNDLASEGVLLEGAGGDVSWHGVSVKTGEGINDILGLILLLAEVDDLKYNPNIPARGFIIESHKDNRRGVVASVIIKEGVLKEGDKVATASAEGRVKFLENFMGKREDNMHPSSPAAIIGFETIPKAGEEFWVGEQEAGSVKAGKLSTQDYREDTGGKLKAILKAETSGSLEALKQLIEPLVYISETSVGDISAADVSRAVNTGSVIVAFAVKADKSTESLAQIRKIRIFSSNVIYDLVKDVQMYIKKETSFNPTGELETLKIFDNKGKAQVIGCKVLVGTVANGADVEIWRGKVTIGTGKITNLQSMKKVVTEVKIGVECGILLATEIKVMVGDVIKAF